jgi:nitroreductase
MEKVVPVYLEVAPKRTFACAVDWPGWARPGRTEEEALASLLQHGPRYARTLKGARLGFAAPLAPAQLQVVERLEGNATTEFGAPAIAPAADAERSCDAATLKRFEAILKAGWRAFDAVATAAAGVELAKGPRGGGRTLAQIVAHVVEADANYLGALGWKAPKDGDPAARLAATREAIFAALRASAGGQISEAGPRGGRRWTARYGARRIAWHVLAHAWEVERRTVRE